jgi:quinoprotein glucose dehydrogenase
MSAAAIGREARRPSRRPWFLLAVAALLALAGLALAAGGVLLVNLGGSPYYLLAGLAMLACAVLLALRSPWAPWLYALLVLATLAWAVAEIGLDWWQLVPRGDVVFVFGVLLCLPWAFRPLTRPGRVPLRGGVLALAASLVLAAVVGVAALVTPDGKEWSNALVWRDALAPASLAAQGGDWPAYGGTWSGQKFSPLAQITPANVGRLERVWTFHTGDRPRPGDPNEFTNEVTPIEVGNTLYGCTPHDVVYALDPETGAVRWKYDPHIRVSPNLQHLTCRGVSYARVAGGDCPERIFLATNDARLIALDPRTGTLCSSFGEGGQLDLWAGMPHVQDGWYQLTSAPLVTRGKVVLAGSIYDNAAATMPSGVIRAFDAATGSLAWNFDPGNPTQTSPIPPGQSYVPSTPNSWSTSAADDALGLIYVPMGNGAVDQWGGSRSPETERYTATILALDADTGKERWHFQTVHHDLWDMDVPAQPALVDLDMPGKGRVPALVQSTKTGNVFVLDRRTGAPLLPVVERPVPGGPAPGDHLSPTQPFSAASFFPQVPIREKDMWGITPFDQLACRLGFRHLRYDGPFTPPSLQGTIVFPGNFGVMDWGGMAIDPVHQVAFAHPNYMAFVDKLVPQAKVAKRTRGPSGGSDLGHRERGLNPNRGAPFAVLLNPFLSEVGLPCQAPPWGYVAGLDLTTGKIAWRRVNGTIRDQSPVPLPIEMGVPSLGGPMVTAGGLAFLGSTLDYYLRAYDMRSGRMLWHARLPAGAQASPMSYCSPASGRQFVVVMAGGHRSLGTALGDELVAYALPQGTS